MDAKLVIVGGDAKTNEIKLKLPVVIGRGREASLTLPHALASRRHCEIIERDGHLWVRDLQSLNGTFIGNERVDEAILPPGELLTIGNITFRAEYSVSHQVPEADAADRSVEAVPPSAETIRTTGHETVNDRSGNEVDTPEASVQIPSFETSKLPPDFDGLPNFISDTPVNDATANKDSVNPSDVAKSPESDHERELLEKIPPLTVSQAAAAGELEGETQEVPRVDDDDDYDDNDDDDDDEALTSFLKGLGD
ncbi:MAG: FHA domain-containing protein [Pirellulaceae bacterium]|nr:FHA domain-containing protein [Pirellulaceae bacterium]